MYILHTRTGKFYYHSGQIYLTIMEGKWLKMMSFPSWSWDSRWLTNANSSSVFMHVDAARVHDSHEWLKQPPVYGVVCFWGLIGVQPKLKLTCFLHALWSSVNVSWAAARVSCSSFARRDCTQASWGYQVVLWQPAVVRFFLFFF